MIILLFLFLSLSISLFFLSLNNDKLAFRVQDAVKKQKLLQKELEEFTLKEKEAQEKIDDDSKRLEKWTAKENLLHQKIEDATEKIASLGALPQADPAYTRMSLKNVSVSAKLFIPFSDLKLCFSGYFCSCSRNSKKLISI